MKANRVLTICDNCKKELNDASNFVSLQPKAEYETPYMEISQKNTFSRALDALDFCNAECFMEYFTKLFKEKEKEGNNDAQM